MFNYFPPPRKGVKQSLIRVFLRFLRLMIPVWDKALLVVMGTIVVSTLRVVNPWLSKFLIDDAFPNQDWNLFYRIFAAYVVLVLIQRLVGTMTTILNHYVDLRVSLALKTYFFTHLQRLSMTFYESRGIGEHMYRASADTGAVMRMITDILPATLRAVYEFILILIFTTWLDWRVSLVILIYSIPYGLVAQKIATIQRRFDRRVRERWQARDAGLQEGVAGAAIVQTFGRRRHEVKRYVTLTIEGYRAAMRLFYMRTIEREIAGNSGLLPWAKNRLIRLYFLREVIIGNLSYGSVFPIFSYTNRLSNPIQVLIRYFQQVRIAMVPAERILETLDQVPAVTDRRNAPAMPPIRGDVVFDNVSFSYEDGTPVLRNLSFTVQAGQKIALVGHSGSGKTTVVNMLLRLYDPGSGRVIVDGQDLREVRSSTYQDQIGLVLQETHLFNGTIKENILFGQPHASDDEVVRAAQLADIDAFASSQRNGYDTDLREGTRISGGQKQRIGIARAMVRDPKILILDEPTSSLDSATEQRFLQSLNRVAEGRTTFVVSHRLTTVANADQIIVLGEGQIIEQGTHAELLRNGGEYAEMYRRYLGLDDIRDTG